MGQKGGYIAICVAALGSLRMSTGQRGVNIILSLSEDSEDGLIQYKTIHLMSRISKIN